MKDRVLRAINRILLFAIFALVAIAFIGHCTTCHAKDTTTVVKPVKNLVITSQSRTIDTILVGYTVELDGVRHEIHKSARSYWYWRTSKKTGKQYRCYLTHRQKQQLGLP